MSEDIGQQDLDQCMKFFNRPIPDVVSETANSFSYLRTVDSQIQKLDLLCLIFDLIGTECVQEITKLAGCSASQGCQDCLD
ncbi:hypothetical protein KM546_gp26 [Porcine lymphotropic herpesvirus 3]|uniref:Uncharacterized protein n=1 Tax=Suid gammaherpesvirus 5 TaxID=1960251 RepID=Q8B3Z2_9GAMA|nr:hypothetical protein KM546_gp26 [Porcine lymphotropic herpesvirus 3]AAO12332.1 unknown [Porcine lymphotropic herpesvirus 3]